jgi:hypothetical protein
MQATRDLDFKILEAACANKGQRVEELIESVSKEYDTEEMPSPRTIRRRIDQLSIDRYLSQPKVTVIYPTAKAYRKISKCQEDA